MEYCSSHASVFGISNGNKTIAMDIATDISSIIEVFGSLCFGSVAFFVQKIGGSNMILILNSPFSLFPKS
jgi:hypothetical protein